MACIPASSYASNDLKSVGFDNLAQQVYYYAILECTAKARIFQS